MKSARWHRVEALVQQGLEMSPDEREHWLVEICGADQDLHREVDSLLAAHDAADGFFESLVGAEAQLIKGEASLSKRSASGHAMVGQRLGAHQIDGILGQGGMSMVYSAHRVDQLYDEQVAIKVIRRGMDSESLERRFRQERQILARLDHPNIARLMDGGTTTDGLPYLVMEQIEGVPIDQFCRQQDLDTDERLDLFLHICSAVQYAHRNLVVHRDLKPSNILVTADRVPKLLDFGIAKLLDPDIFTQTVAPTAADGRMMTPAYASPEQVRGEMITTASDVYSLGVVLYELLTGQRPYRFDSFQPAEMERVICHQEPEEPSLAVLRSDEEKTLAAPLSVFGKASENAALKKSRRLQGDLDNIVLMALRKEPERRYASVEQLEKDAWHHLKGLPVSARKDTWGYRGRKFIQRNRLAVWATALVVLAIFTGLTTTLWQARVAMVERTKAEQERDSAEQIATFLEGLFELSNPETAKVNTVTALELLDEGARKIAELDNQPRIQARLMGTIGTIYRKLGVYERAEELLSHALENRRGLWPGDHLEIAQGLDDLANIKYEQGEFKAAGELYSQALEMHRRLAEGSPLALAETLDNLAEVLRRRGELEEAEGLYREALEIKRRQLGEEHSAIALSFNNLGGLLQTRGNFVAAEAMHRRALEMRRRLLGEKSTAVADSLNNLASVLFRQGRPEAAEPLFRQALERRQELLGEEHPAVARTMTSLAKSRLSQGQVESAEPLLQRSLELKRQFLGNQHPSVALTLDGLAQVAHAKGDFSQEEKYLEEALAIRQRLAAGS